MAEREWVAAVRTAAAVQVETGLATCGRPVAARRPADAVPGAVLHQPAGIRVPLTAAPAAAGRSRSDSAAKTGA
ncbi:hypothetical protein [Euzebya pacifica]|nr:hypothetical protein [Euzebya pacifica]